MADVLDALRESLAPHYDIERLIGAGGMARVFLAVEQHPHRRVAIKVIDPELSNRLLRERFIREVDLSSRSEEHTSELQSRSDLVCRLLLEKKKKKIHDNTFARNYQPQYAVD